MTSAGQSLGQATILGSSLFTDTSTFGADGEADTSRTFALEVATAVSTGLHDTASGEAVVLSVVAGVVQGRTATTDALVFTVAVNADGNVTLTQYRAVEHPDADDPDEADAPAMLADGCITLAVTVEDGDGDTSEARLALDDMIGFADDGPTVSLSVLQTARLVVDETAGAQSPESAPEVDGIQTLGRATIAASALFSLTSSYGSDGPADASARVYTLVLETPDATGLVDSLSGEDVVLTIDADSETVHGRTIDGDALVFTVSVDAATGALTLTQYRAVMHDDPDDADESSAPAMLAAGCLALGVTVTDGDGDEAYDEVALDGVIGFEDDGPMAFQPEAATVGNGAGATFTGDLDVLDASVTGDVAGLDASAGSDGRGAVAFDIPDGTVLYGTVAGVSQALKSGGNAIYLFVDDTGTLVATTDATGADGTRAVFTVTLDTASGEYTVEMLGRIDNGSSVTYDNFGSGKAGLRDWFIVRDPRPEPDGLNLLVTGRHPGQDQVNNDSDDISVNNQWIDPRDPHDATGGEAVRFSFVYGGSTLTNTSTLAGISEPLDYYTANNVGAKVMQIGGSPSNRVDIRVSTYDGDATLGGSSESAIAAAMMDDPMDEIVEAWVVNAAGETILRDYRAGSGTERYDPNNQIVFSQTDGSVKFLNCATGHTVYVRTADGFNAVMYENAEAESGGKDVFALGAIDVGTVDSGDPITMGFDMTFTDADGDASTGVLDLALTPVDPYA
jgi:hypothetical protein